jgi:hypothetical protein
MVTYDSADIYIEAASSLTDKITRIDDIIDALLTTALKAAASGHLMDYLLNDGQTTIRTTYRSPKQVQDAITAFEGIRQVYSNRLNGRAFRLVDGANFR